MSKLESWELTLEEICTLSNDTLELRRAKQQQIAKQLAELGTQLDEARTIISALLGAPPPRVWRKWPKIYERAVAFLNKSPCTRID